MGRLNIKVSVFNLIYGFSTIQIIIPESYFVDIDKLFLKFIWQGNRPKMANTILKKNKSED